MRLAWRYVAPEEVVWRMQLDGVPSIVKNLKLTIRQRGRR